MPQKLVNIQEQKQQQVQRLTAQQMLNVHLLEMPLTELEQSINAEIDDNPALEISEEGRELKSETDDEQITETFEQQTEREERADALDAALENIGRDDEMPEYHYSLRDNQAAEYEEIVYGDPVSFYDKLREQMGEQMLTEKQEQMMEYLIGSLDDDGLLRKDLDSICDELAIYHHLDCSLKEINEVLHILQEFDPPGIGARNLQECLLLQIKRKPDSIWKERMEKVIKNYYDAFTKKHWNKIATALSLDDEQTETLRTEIHRLNPKPGAALGETEGRNTQQITPDFIVETTDDGVVTFMLNRGDVPELHISQTFNDLLKSYQENKQGMTRKDKEALLYTKEKVTRAQEYINAVKQRQLTMTKTMKAIIDLQRKFFQEGDETELRPMILKDVAERTGLDISTISRVSNLKYAQTRWGMFPLRFFFSEGYTTADGEEMSTRKIKVILKETIDAENKNQPLSDEALTKMMKEKGFPIARRTVAKYREQLGIPVARLRKEDGVRKSEA